MTCTPARLARLQRKREYERLTRPPMPRVHKGGQGPHIPADVEVRAFSGPCFFCEESGACRHRSEVMG